MIILNTVVPIILVLTIRIHLEVLGLKQHFKFPPCSFLSP